MRKMLSVTLAAAMVMGLAGCGGGAKNEPAATSAAATTAAATEAGSTAAAGETTAAAATDKEPVTLTFWHRDGNTTSNPIYAELIKKFQEKYPWITIEYLSLIHI